MRTARTLFMVFTLQWALTDSDRCVKYEFAIHTLASMERSVDVVVDATGVPAVVEGLFKLVANGGNVLLFGVCPPDSRSSISAFDIFRRQIRVAGAHSLNHNIPEAMAVLRRSGEAMSKIISHELPLSDIASYLDGPHGGGSMKVQYKAF